MRCWYVSSPGQTDAASLGASAPLSNNYTALIRQHRTECFEWCRKSSSRLPNSASITLGRHFNGRCSFNSFFFSFFFSLNHTTVHMRSSSGLLVESSALGSNCVFLVCEWQQVFTHFALQQMEKIPHNLVLFLQVRVTDGVGSSRLVSAAQIVYHAGFNGPFCLHTSQEVCWLWGGWVRHFSR